VAEAVSVGLELDSGQVAWGDCVAVEFSAKAGRDAIFRCAAGSKTIHETVAPYLQDREITSFRELASHVDALVEDVKTTRPLSESGVGGDTGALTRRALLTAPGRALRTAQEPESQEVTVRRLLHTAVRFGVSQALLEATALVRGMTMTEVICDEWSLPLPSTPVDIHAQSGGERYSNADKMIVRRVASLPHALVDNIPEQLGCDGALLIRYARWLRERIEELGGPDYRPTIHLDVHGALGHIFEDNLGRVLGVLRSLELAVRPYALRVECPVLMDSQEAQIEALRTLREYIRFRDMEVQLVADEWANSLADIQLFADAQAVDMIQIKMPDLGSVHNSVEAVLACKAGDVGAFLGGSCAETVRSAHIAVHIALATQPDIIMAKPGMGVDEAVSLVNNEMARVLKVIPGH
jgi:methylaspartate ammonia-lyase